MEDREGTKSKALYLIRVRDKLDERWSDWFGGVEMAPEQAIDGSPITMLTGTFDHAALHGVLDRLRDLNMTLISVTRMEPDPGQEGEGRGQAARDGMAQPMDLSTTHRNRSHR